MLLANLVKDFLRGTRAAVGDVIKALSNRLEDVGAGDDI